MILGLVLVIYACTAGYDSGITMFMPFFRQESKRRVLLNVSAPTWDGNLTWIVFAGGGMFVVWPAVYSTAFSGMYAALLLVLWSLFFRPPGYEYRSKLPSHTWKRCWDFGLFISSFMPVFLFGVATGNAFVGFPFHFDPHTYRVFFTGSIFNLLSPFGVLSGAISVVMILMHGAAYAMHRTEGELYHTVRRLHIIFAAILLLLFTITGIVIMNMSGYHLIASPPHPTITPLLNKVGSMSGDWFLSYAQYPWKFYGPIIAYAGIIISMWANHVRWLRAAFWSSCFGVGGIIATAGFSLFPFIMPSSTNPNQSLTVWNATSSQYALNIMLYVGVVLLFIILCYKIFAFHTIWSQKPTLTEQDLLQDKQEYY
ncbi:MAG: cytochrome d ubiquinol oxidase subunit II [Gammaproteobacteria bacterium]|nr:cytochrome d ubiquinol oxidase subunit II [Gammaproteobacteria bacterium]